MIEDWVQQHHLTGNAIAEFRREFHNGGTSILRVSDFLHPELAETLYSFLAADANWTVRTRNLRSQVNVSEDVWKRASDKERLSSMLSLDPHDLGKPGRGLCTFKRLMFDLRNDGSISSWFSAVSSLPLKKGASVSAKAFDQSDFLGPHSDRTGSRSLAFIFYLSRDWEPEFGGGLRMRTDDVRESFFEYEYNSLIMFDVSCDQLHWLDPIEPAACGRVRFTIGGWFNNRQNSLDGHEVLNK